MGARCLRDRDVLSEPVCLLGGLVDIRRLYSIMKEELIKSFLSFRLTAEESKSRKEQHNTDQTG